MPLVRVLVVAVLLAVGLGAGSPTTSRSDRQDAEAFLRQLDSATVDDIGMQIDEVAGRSLQASVNANRLVLLGQDGGAQDPSAIYTVVRDLELRGVGLDWPARLQGPVEDFLRTGEVSDELAAAGGAGIVSPGHLEMLRRLHAAALLADLFLYGDDGPASTGVTADRARIVLQRSSSRIPTLVVTQAAHVRAPPVRLPDGTLVRPMAEDIRRVIPAVAVIELSYSADADAPALYRRPDGSYVIELSDAAAPAGRPPDAS